MRPAGTTTPQVGRQVRQVATMRGVKKAAALLSSVVASAFVVPDTLTSGVGLEASNPRVEYRMFPSLNGGMPDANAN